MSSSSVLLKLLKCVLNRTPWGLGECILSVSPYCGPEVQVSCTIKPVRYLSMDDRLLLFPTVTDLKKDLAISKNPITLPLYSQDMLIGLVLQKYFQGHLPLVDSTMEGL